MVAYLVRRIGQAIPTLLGVILVTFLLFNVVGGSPAALTLGEKANPRMLEEFDEQRGFNKPLVAGRWTPTRALPDDRFAAGAPPRRLEGRGRFELPLAFPLRPDTAYRVTARYRLPPGSRAAFGPGGAPAPAAAAAALAADGRWHALDARFRTGPAADPPAPAFAVEEGSVEIAGLRLRRGNAHVFDSQFAFYLGRLARLDFGRSHWENQRVAAILRQGVGPSLALTVPIFAVGLVTALAAALFCAWARDSWADRLLVVVCVALMSVNYVVWIVLGQYVLGFRLGWFPVWGFESWRYVVLPALIGIVSGLGADVRFYRTVMLDEMYRDYVRTARAKGLGRARILFRHVLPNAMIPVLTSVITAIPFLFTGSLLLESFFGIPGLGYLGVNALTYSDVDVLRAIVLVGAALYMAANLLTDLAYAWADPRVRLG